MNTLSKTLSALSLTLILLTATSLTASAAEFTFNRIKVSGNVKLEVVKGDRERIEIISGSTSRGTIIKKQNYTLIIKSTEDEPVTVRVYATELSRIDAAGQAQVESRGTLNLKYLQVFLADEAKANIKANSESMYTFLKGNSHLNISGTTADHTLVMDTLAKLNMGSLVALKTTTSSMAEVLALNKIAK